MPFLYVILSCAVLLIPSMLSAAQAKVAAPQQQNSQFIVDANLYDAFWIWGNISSAPYLERAQQIYILQGEIRANKTRKQSELTPQGISVRHLPKHKIWLVFRSYHLNWQTDNIEKIVARMQQWERNGNQIVGLQIDFDSKTSQLKPYALFLKQLRQQLPAKYQLSITGLMDWSNIKDAETLSLLRENIDELIIQSYQGTTTIANADAYLNKIPKLNLPYKIGIVQHGQWAKQKSIEQDPNFKGYVVFLLRNPT